MVRTYKFPRKDSVKDVFREIFQNLQNLQDLQLYKKDLPKTMTEIIKRHILFFYSFMLLTIKEIIKTTYYGFL